MHLFYGDYLQVHRSSRLTTKTTSDFARVQSFCTLQPSQSGVAPPVMLVVASLAADSAEPDETHFEF